MTWKDALFPALFGVALVAVCSGLGYNAGRRSVRPVPVDVRRDTLYVEVHDTAFVEVERRVVRHDTVRLARVDTAYVTDSVTVEVPISSYAFEGDGYRIAAEGYRVALTDVWVRERLVTQTQVVRSPRRWAFGVGVQAGYGLTLGGASPYIGAGVTFGWWF